MSSEQLDGKIKSIGELNSALEMMERSAKRFEDFWNDGVYRLLPDDIADCEAKLRRGKALLARIKAIVDLFGGIANHRQDKKPNNKIIENNND